MIHYRASEEIEIMKEGGKILALTLDHVLKAVKPGIKLSELDAIAEHEIVSRGGYPSFKKVPGYHWTICACLNDVVVHGIPDDTKIQPGDVVGIDCGVYYKGFHTDSSWTIRVPKPGSEQKDVDNFLNVGAHALHKAIKTVKVGNYIYDISKTIQEIVEGAGFSVARTLVGHGVGRELHEDPEIPGFVRLKRERTPQIKLGMTLAVEVIYMMGGSDIAYRKNDEWTIRTKDGTLSGLFEATVAVSSHGCIVLTKIYGA